MTNSSTNDPTKKAKAFVLKQAVEIRSVNTFFMFCQQPNNLMHPAGFQHLSQGESLSEDFPASRFLTPHENDPTGNSGLEAK